MTPTEAVTLLRQALNHHQRGQIEPAEGLYRQVLAEHPAQPDALRYLGTLLHQKGQNVEAATMLRTALTHIPPGHPVTATIYNNLGEALRAQGGSQIEAAIPFFHKALGVQKNYPQARNNLATALAILGRTAEAITELRGLLKENPAYFKGHLNLGNLLLGTNDYRGARTQFTAALQLASRPKTPFAATTKAGAIQPPRPAELAAAHAGLATCAYKSGDLAMAVQSYEQAIALDPERANYHLNLGEALRLSGRSDAAEAAILQAIQLDPRLPEAHSKLGHARAMRGDHAQGAADLRRATTLAPNDPALLSNWLFEMQYLSDISPAEVLAEHRQWSDRFEKPLNRPMPPLLDPRPDRQLRVALLSGDFRAHPVTTFLQALLTHHDRQALTLVAYSDVSRPDEVTADVRKKVHEFYDVESLNDLQLAQRLVTDRIDIAIDLAGHTGRNRLRTMALRPCPVQVTWIGYPSTTGVVGMTHRFTDAAADPAGYEAHASETLFRLDPCFLCYTPPPDAPEVKTLPAQKAGHITFGSFNNIAKVADATLALWRDVLAAVPKSRLKVKGIGLVEESTRQRVMARAVAAGVPGDRLELLPPTSAANDHLATYHHVDIALDTTPYNGTTTTCEALLMGVPVITLAGDRHVSRVGASLLSAAGHPEWVAQTPPQYVDVARQLSNDLTGLATIRADLRRQLIASPLCDGPAHAAAVASALRNIWTAACAGK